MLELEWNLEKDPNFIQWVGDVVEDGYRYAIVVARTGTGVKWVKYYPAFYKSDHKLTYSHGNFYGETREEAILEAEAAVKQLLQLDALNRRNARE